MSKISDKLENDLVSMVNNHRGERIPSILPDFFLREGIRPEAKIVRAEGIGSKDKNNKTDVIIYLENSEPIKISAKLSNADYFGNWYGHERFLKEFEKDAFCRMTKAATIFANEWFKTAIAPYVGVSICFGRRTGRTGQDFLDIFETKDILTVARGYGNTDATANSMYISNSVAKDIQDLILKLQEITEDTVNRATESFKVAFRPINPLTEGTNRGKNVYTKFQPFGRLNVMTKVETVSELRKLGTFVEVEPTRLNHNHILTELEQKYNIFIPRKPKS